LLGATLVVLALFGVGLTIGSAFGLLPGAPVRQAEPPEAPGQTGQAPSAASEPAVVITERTTLSFLTSYAACGCSVRESRVAGIELAGRDAGSFGHEFAGYTVQSFAADSVSLFRLLPGYCPDMMTFRTLGIKDGRVAVYLGRPGTGLLIARVTGIEAKDLPARDQEKLAAGIVLTGDAAVEGFLEGLTD
jgi:hypothetical protein